MISEVGENYQYVKTIIENKIELKKIALAEDVASLVSFLILLTIALAFIGFTYLIFMAVFTLLLYNALGSLVQTLALLLFSHTVAGILVFVFRRKLLVIPFSKAFYQQFNLF